MKQIMLSLGLASALLFTVNALILTGFLSPDLFASKSQTVGPESRAGERGVLAALPQTPELDATDGAAPLPPETEELLEGDLDAPLLKLASTGPADSIPDTAKIAAIGSSAAVVRAGPSASAGQLFAFPLGRRVRVGERVNGFAKIEDVGSGEVGWVEEAALGPDPTTAQRRKRESYADAAADRPVLSERPEKGRWARKSARRGGLFRRLIGRR